MNNDKKNIEKKKSGKKRNRSRSKERWRKNSESSSYSRSRTRSILSSLSPSRSNSLDKEKHIKSNKDTEFDERLDRMRMMTQMNKKIRSDSPVKNVDIKVRLPNKGILANLINENKRTNKKLDDEELDRANVQFKKLDHSERRAKLMTSHLNTIQSVIDQEEYDLEYKDGEYVKVIKPYICDFNKCGKQFKLSKDLEEHLERHIKNKKRKYDKKSRSRSDSMSEENKKISKLKAKEFIEKTQNSFFK